MQMGCSIIAKGGGAISKDGRLGERRQDSEKLSLVAKLKQLTEQRE